MSDRKENATLAPRAFIPLPLGSVKPYGWLLNQLRIQASGLSGHLDEFWPDVADSGWIGGKAEGWERGPYWLDGIVPLAYLLDDPALKTKVTGPGQQGLARSSWPGWASNGTTCSIDAAITIRPASALRPLRDSTRDTARSSNGLQPKPHTDSVG